MVGRARTPFRGAAEPPPRASRSPLPRRRRRAPRGAEADAEEPQARGADPCELPAPLGGPLPGGRRGHWPRRLLRLERPDGARLELVTRRLLCGRFPFVWPLLQQLRDQAARLRSRRLSRRSMLGLAVFVAILHWVHLKTLFENDRHFSHLSSLEREMTFRTEMYHNITLTVKEEEQIKTFEKLYKDIMGLYYSYFKTIIDAPSFLQGLWMIMNDRITEYPLVINTVKRFYLYPEVIIALWYRTIMGIMNLFGIETKTCWNVTRIESMNEIQSCEGLGDPACFYVGVIFLLNGSLMGLFFMYGTFLSGTQLGGLITVLCYFFNHGEATRVMWTPPLRESFSYPFLILEMYVLTLMLRTSSLNKKHFIALCVSNVAFMLPWQFAQFILFTQIVSLFSMYIVGYIEPSKFQKIIYMNMISVFLCFILMFGNTMYLSSYYSSSLLMACVIILKRNKIQKLGVSELNFWLIQGFAWLGGTIILKFLTSKILGVSDHIRLSDLIAARILRYSDFDTLLYTCAPEFDFMEKATPLRYTKTLLLPVVIMIACFICKKTVRDVLCVLSANTYLRKHLLEHGELTFHLLQLVSFTIIAILILRMKLFLTPHMCIMASLLCSQRLFGWLFSKIRFENIVFGILTAMSIQGCANLHSQWSVMGEFSNLPQEELIQWIKYNTRQDAVFAGAMPTMASVKLSTLRPIVNHPHYEDADLRARTKIVYSTYSRKSAKEVRDKLMGLYVNYYVFEEAWCVVRTKPGCSMLEIWDLEDPSNAANPPLCSVLLSDAKPYFTTVFQNSVYRVLKVNAA